jgi:hypothetical protein
VVHSLLSKSQSFSRLISLGCALHKCFLPSPLDKDEIRRGWGGKNAIPLGRIRLLQKSTQDVFVLENASSIFYSDLLFSSPLARTKREYFSAPHHVNLERFLEVKPTKYAYPPNCSLQKFLTLSLVHTSSLYIMAPAASAPGKQIIPMTHWIYLLV